MKLTSCLSKAVSSVLPAFFLSLIPLQSLQADTLARWSFESAQVDQPYSDTSPEGYAPEESSAAVLVGRVRLGAANSAQTASKIRDKAHTLGTDGTNCLDVAGWTQAVDTSRYLELSLEPVTGSAIYLNSITLLHGGNGLQDMVPQWLDVRVRVGTSEWHLLAQGIPVLYNDGSAPTDPDTFRESIYLAHSALQGTEEPVTIRFQSYGAGALTSKWRIDDVTVSGHTGAIPSEAPALAFEGIQVNPGVTVGGLYSAQRLNDEAPIMTQSMFADLGVASEGDNINGASVIRLPDWLPSNQRAHPAAKYYLYFAHHAGDYIRMAWAAELEGPWTLYHTGAGVPVGSRGVLDLGSDDRIEPGNGIVLRYHVASPDVLIDEANQQFLLFFHAPTNLSGPVPSPTYLGAQAQRSFVATSSDGLNFNMPADGGQTGHGVHPVSLGLFYFRVFEVNGRLHAFTNRGVLYRAPLGQAPFHPPAGFDYGTDYWKLEPAPEMLYAFHTDATSDVEEPRHVDYIHLPDGIRVFYTQVYGTPERMLAADISFNGSDDWADWTIDQAEPYEVLAPELAWEGAFNTDLGPSQNGSASNGEHALRDPAVLEDEGKLFVFYSGGGEDAIGLAELKPLSTRFESEGISKGVQPDWWNLDLSNGFPRLRQIRAEISTTGLDASSFGPPADQFLLDRGDGTYRLKVHVPGSPARVFIRARGEAARDTGF